MKKIQIKDLKSLPEAAKEFMDNMGNANVFTFRGEMGAGKTTFIRELVRQMGVGEDLAVNSPSFSIVNEYRSDITGALIYHFDLYRLENIEEALDIGIEDYLESGVICLIEWPDLIDPLLPVDTVDVDITVDPDDNSRTLSFQIEGQQ